MNRKLSAIILSAFTIPLTGCYVLSQAGPYLSQRGKARDIGKVIDDPATDQETRQFLERVLDIKGFAVENGLKEDKNYSSYKELDKDYLAVVISACPPYSFEPYMWNYPFLGKMPYKGFINEDGVQKEIDRLKEKGLEVYAREVDAFSSLGYFKDPLYSFMKNYSEYDLAELLLHEQTHATIFFKNQSQFNEEIATFSGETLGRKYIASRFGKESEIYKDIDTREKDSAAFRKLMLSLKTELEELFGKDIDKSRMAGLKKEIIGKFQDDVKENYHRYFITENYRGLATMTLNNAFISLFNTYNQDLHLYQKLYEMEDESIAALIARLQTLKKEKDPKAVIRKWVGE